MNEFKSEARATYARVMIDFEIGPDDGVGPVITNLDLPKSDLLLLNNILKEQATGELKSQGIALLKWYGTRLVQKKGFSYISSSFLRQYGTNKPVMVELNMITSRGITIYITISCREEESASTFKDLLKIMDTVKLIR